MQPAERRPGGEPAAASVRRGDRGVGLVRYEEGALNPLEYLRRDLFSIVEAGVRAADAGHLVSTALAARADARWSVTEPVTLVAAGKAAVPMAVAFAETGVPIRAGLVVATHAPFPVPAGFEWHRAGHPVPTEVSEQAGRRALELATASTGPLVLLLSGGASALLAVPASGLTLEDKRRVTSQLLAAGADIYALNTVRKHLSAIKGGRLAAAARGPTLAWAVSDVVGDDLSVIGSGPTVADPTTFLDALHVLDRYGGRANYQSSVVRHLEAGVLGHVRETPKPGDPQLSSTSTRIIGSRLTALAAARERAAAAGYRTFAVEEAVTGEAREVAAAWVARMARLASDTPQRAAIVSTGETTVHVVGSGRGGRNQEFVLAAAPLVAELGRPAVLASVGTDGIDGPTDAAGAMADAETTARIERAGLSAADALTRNDAYPLFEALGDLVRTGPTSTNVGDLQVLLLGERPV